MRPFRTPAFWYDSQGFGARVLAGILGPFSWFYNVGRRVHNLTRPPPRRVGIPVLCIGNLTAGGSGKTPLAVSLFHLIRAQGLAHQPFFLTRGYGGAQSGPLRVDPSCHDFRAVGDEALLLARHAPTILARDRCAGAEFAKAQGADCLILDDGFQNPSLFKDIAILVIDGAAGFGNGRLLPAGPLREPLPEALARADGFVLVGPDLRNVHALLPPEKPVFEARLRVLKAPESGRAWVAFAGLGRPEKFLETLGSVGIRPVSWTPFPDHHPYSEADLTSLAAQARALGAGLLTTEKDALRLPPGFSNRVEILPVSLDIKEKTDILAFLESRVRSDQRP